MIEIPSFFGSLRWAALVSFFSIAGLAGAAERPNILLIMGDDMGYSDLGCYGSEIETPNLDALAGDGLRFTQFYNTARCCPTRASLLSGLYPHQAGVGHMMDDRGYDGYRGEINRECLTIAEVLRGSGYATFMAGKWHITKATAPDGPKDNWPLQRGFDRFYGTIHGAGSFFDPNSLTRDNTMISPYADPEYKPEQYYYTDAISDHAVRFIADNAKGDAKKPFFLYVAYTAAHWPMHALEKDIAKYKGKYDGGYTAIRERRFARMKELGVIAPDAALSPQAEDWATVKDKAWEARCMEVYAAMVDSMDQGIGRIMDELKRQGQFENTLVFFLQDNGGCAEGLGRQSSGAHTIRPDKPVFPPMAADELQRDMIPKQTRDGYPTIQGPGGVPGQDGTYIAYGQGWANVSNTPHREYKHWVHEGGIATPLVVHWPAGVARKGELEKQSGHLIDIMATCVEVSGATYPSEFAGKTIKPMEGRSLKPAFEGKAIEREALYWEHEGNRAVRVGDMKLVAKGANGPWELYDIGRDRAELHDLAKKKPAITKDLAAKWQAYAKRANVLPLNATPRKAAPKQKAAAAPKKKPAGDPMARIEDDPKLPRVLLIGDSISIGYTLAVRELLAGKANVHRPQTNCGPTTNGLKNLDAWLGDGKWDVIHFNWGLHDLKYVGSKGEVLADVGAEGSLQQVPIAEYEANLKTLVERLKKTGAKLVWCATTPVPAGAKGRVPGDEVKYNEAAARVMQEAGIPTDDLYAFALPKLAKIQNKADVHYTQQGSRQLAKAVVEAITAQLPER